MARHRGQKWGARDLGMPGLKTWQREALKRIIAKRGVAYVREAIRQGTVKPNPRRSGHIGMRDLDVVATDRATGIMLARLGSRYVVAEPVRAGTSFHGWMPRDQAKACFRRLTTKSNPRKAVRIASKQEHRRDRTASRIIREVLSDEGRSRYTRRHRVLRARMRRRGVAMHKILAFNDKNRRRNPPRDPVYQGDFTVGHEPKRTGPYVDGDSAVVQSPYRASKNVEAPWEVWIFGTIDPRLGDRWNYAAGPMGKSDAIAAAKQLVRF